MPYILFKRLCLVNEPSIVNGYMTEVEMLLLTWDIEDVWCWLLTGKWPVELCHFQAPDHPPFHYTSMDHDVVVPSDQISGSLPVSGGVQGNSHWTTNQAIAVVLIAFEPIGLRQYVSVISDAVSVYLKWLQRTHPVWHCGFKLTQKGEEILSLLHYSTLICTFFFDWLEHVSYNQQIYPLLKVQCV